jgi:O-acetyl-ADP-ribose deacetylase (regulator of RNase III)
MQPAPVPRRASRDYALVLGVVGTGPGVSGAGAEARARAFVDWLIAPAGGGLPGDHVHALIGPEATIGAASLRQMLYELVPGLDDQIGSGGTVGRRCYLYLAGPAVQLSGELRLAARDASAGPRLLDASFQRFVSYLRTTRVFDEVVAFADVERVPWATERTPRLPVFPDSEPVSRAAPADAFAGVSAPNAAAGGPSANDAPDDPAGTLGFTGAIIEALTSGAIDDTGAITAESFVKYVGPRLRQWLGPTGDMPRYEYSTSPPFVFLRPPAPAQSAAAAGTAARMPNAYALLIGIDDYVTIPRLSGCADDARALGAALSDPRVGGYDPQHVGILTDRDATREIVISAFGALAEQCDADSTVLVWFSGRASVGDDGATTIFLADDDLSSDVKGLSAGQLDAMLDRLRSQRVVVIFDTSGGCAGMAVHVGRVLLSATLPEEAAYTGSDGTGGGDFTGAILRAVNGGGVWRGYDLSVFDVFEYAHADVVRHGKQHPTIGMRWGEIGFPIAKAPLAPSVAGAADADGFLYDVHVVHSLKSPRAGFVESVLLPALRDAGLRVAVSAWLETSPVGRVVQMQRGLERSRRTLVLDSRSSSGDADFDDVLRLALGSQPALIDGSQFVIVALEGGRSLATQRQVVTATGETLLVETEPFDLITAQTALHGSVRNLIDRLKAPLSITSGSPARNATDEPLVEDAEESTPPRVWPVPADESEIILDATVSHAAQQLALRTVMHRGDVVLLTESDEPVTIVGVTRVLRAFDRAGNASEAGGSRTYDLAASVHLATPVTVSTDTVSVSSILVDVATRIVQQNRGTQRDAGLALLAPVLGAGALADLLGVALALPDPVQRRSAARGVAWQLRTTSPNAVQAIDALRADADPAVRALVPSTSAGAPPFLNACFFDATLERSRLAKVAGTLGVELQRWRSEPLYVHERELAPFEQTVGVMRQSACIVLVWSSEKADEHWHALMREAAAIDDHRMAHFGERGVSPTVSTIVTLVVDGPNELPPELASRPMIDGMGLTSTSGEAIVSFVSARLVEAALASSQLLIEHPLGALPALSRAKALDRIEIVTGDLLDAEVDAIVNPIGTTATDTGEIGVQLFERIGNWMLVALERHDSLVAGETRVILTSGKIPARYVIHTCTRDHRRGHTVESVTVGALGALRAAEALPSVRRIALPALGSGAAGIPPADIARAVLPALVDQIAAGSRLERIRFFIRDNAPTAAAYRAALEALRTEGATTATVNADRWYLSLRQATVGTTLVGSTVALGLFFSRDEHPDAAPIDIPVSAFELTVYVDATAAFHLDGSSQQTVVLREGQIDATSLPLRLLALTSGTHTIRVTANARGGRTAGTEAVLTCPVTVEPPLLLPDIPELIDRRTIPSPQPDVVLYVATEPTARSERLRIHLTCAALGMDRRRIDAVLPLDTADAAGIRLAAADAAADLDSSSPPDARAALLAFGATLYDVLVPRGHELRAIFARLLALPTRGDRPLSWLVVSDEAAALPWELVCPHGYTADATHWYDEPLATRFAVAHWISGRGFEMPNEAPVGPLGVVHYGQRGDTYTRWRDAIGADLANEADRHLGLDILRRGSPYFGVHLLRFTDPNEAGRIMEATAPERVTSDPLGGERRLDFTLRRPIVSLSFVDAALDHGAPSVRRYTNIEPAWVAPFLLARSSAVVGPRWTTAPSSDRLFYRTFYDAVRADHPLGLAVWEARDALRTAYPDRADWLAYTYFGHPACEPYPVEDAEGFTLFEPMGLTPDEPFVAGRDYPFRASFRGELPAWYNGRRHVRTTRLRGDDVQVLVAPLHGGDPVTLGLIGASGDTESDDDFWRQVILSMPNDAGTYKWFVQFTRGDRELRSSIITLDVVANDAVSEASRAEAARLEVLP